jgi:hypothetical protein
MSPGTDPGAAPGAAAAAEAREGAEYARAFLSRVAAGLGDPLDLAALVGFLHSGPMLHGGCAVLFEALRHACRQAGGR